MKKFAALAILSLFLLPLPAWSVGKFDMMGGYYSLTAKAQVGEGSFANFGSYLATYNYSFLDSLDFSVGYSLFFADVVTGDMGYGPDLGFTFYPLTNSSSLKIITDRVQILMHEKIRPFINFSFNQRQFQSVQAAYAGFSLAGGTEYYWNSIFSFKGMFRMQLLKGPEGASGRYMDFLFGVSFGI